MTWERLCSNCDHKDVCGKSKLQLTHFENGVAVSTKLVPSDGYEQIECPHWIGWVPVKSELPNKDGLKICVGHYGATPWHEFVATVPFEGVFCVHEGEEIDYWRERPQTPTEVSSK